METGHQNQALLQNHNGFVMIPQMTAAHAPQVVVPAQAPIISEETSSAIIACKLVKAEGRFRTRSQITCIFALISVLFLFSQGRGYLMLSKAHAEDYWTTFDGKVLAVCIAFGGFSCWVAAISSLTFIFGCYFRSQRIFNVSIFSQGVALILWIIAVAIVFVYGLTSYRDDLFPKDICYEGKLLIIGGFLLIGIIWSAISILTSLRLSSLVARVTKYTKLQKRLSHYFITL
eukprot:TRINITY_DN1566_c0_g2_i2.p1 TRINITY_DN1566_c0_g2~~TRINITY_DN1566_c0_g2_i2.p1  ORF type:complete len:231 (+),score=50.47 TRINITY_DN1566_c0_g2_i2:184-876(+)